VVDIDIQNFFVKSLTPIISSGDSMQEVLENIKKFHSETQNIYSPYEVGATILFDEKFNKLQRMYILKALQKDTRYNIYDRLYLDELFKTIRLEDILGKGVSVRYKPPKYLIFFENYIERIEKGKEDKYYFFRNDVNGHYISINNKPFRVEVGKYYSYNSKTNSYVFDMEKGYYVKYFGGSWAKSTYTFNQLFTITFSQM
ncbi:MAG: hypothetical protein ACP5JS_03885, partial [Fervidobacterium sp.]